MKLIIELNEKQFKDIQRIASIQIRRRSLTCEQIIANGTPLPKNHGRLIDMNVALKVLADEWGYEGIEDDLEYKVPTIIEADKGERK